MADEESEIRRMAEIADAINAILDADPVGDTPAQGSPMARDETVNSENTITETAEPTCLLYTSPSPRDVEESRMPSSA